MHEQLMNHISLNEGRPRCYAKSGHIPAKAMPHQLLWGDQEEMGTAILCISVAGFKQANIT